MEEVLSNGYLKKNVRLFDLLVVMVPLVIWIGGLNLSFFGTLTTHTEQITNLQQQLKEDKSVQKEAHQRLDVKFELIQADLTEIKLLLKDKQDRK